MRGLSLGLVKEHKTEGMGVRFFWRKKVEKRNLGFKGLDFRKGRGSRVSKQKKKKERVHFVEKEGKV